MSRRIVIIALAAAAFGAIGAAGASGETAYTCVESPANPVPDALHTFADAHCAEPNEAEGPYGHEAFGTTPTQLKIHPIGTAVLSAELFGAEVELIATGVECVDCMSENTEGVVRGEGGQLRFTGVQVNHREEGCTVVDDEEGVTEEGGKGTAHQITTMPLRFETTGTSTADIRAVTGAVLAHIKIETSPLAHEEACPPVLTRTFDIEGHAEAAISGATLKVATVEGELEIEEEPAYLEGEATMTAGETGSGIFHSVALTEGAVPPPVKGIRAFTCAKGGESEDFADHHCDESVSSGSGEYGHSSIAVGKVKEIEVTNEGTEHETTDSADAVLEASVVGVAAKIRATKVRGSGSLENAEPEVGVVKAKGEVTMKYTGLHVEEPSGCEVAEPIEFTAAFESIEEGENMGIELKPKEGTTFVDLTFEGEECALDGITAHVKGTAVATGGAGGTAKGSGATAVLEPSHESLGVGKGEASITSTTTIRLKEGDPVALTTVE